MMFFNRFGFSWGTTAAIALATAFLAGCGTKEAPSAESNEAEQVGGYGDIDAEALNERLRTNEAEAGDADAPAEDEGTEEGTDTTGASAKRDTSETSGLEDLPPNVSLATAKEIRELIEAGEGGITVVNFWATWCPPCVKEMPELARFYEDYKDKGVTFLSFSADHHSTTKSTVVPFVNSYELPFPVHVMYLENPDELTEELPLDWDGALPATFVFGPDGSVAESWVGAVTYDILADQVASMRTEGSAS